MCTWPIERRGWTREVERTGKALSVIGPGDARREKGVSKRLSK